jgi:hypothetical protein
MLNTLPTLLNCYKGTVTSNIRNMFDDQSTLCSSSHLLPNWSNMSRQSWYPQLSGSWHCSLSCSSEINISGHIRTRLCFGVWNSHSQFVPLNYIIYIYEVEFFWRQQCRSYSRNSSHFLQPQDHLLCSRQPPFFIIQQKYLSVFV